MKLTNLSKLLFKVLVVAITCTSCAKLGITPVTPIPPVVVVVHHDTIPDNGVIGIKMMKDSIGTDECVIAFKHTALSAYKVGEDAPYGFGAGAVNITSYTTDDHAMSINKFPYKTFMNIKLGVAAKKDTTYLIKIDQFRGIPATVKVWLKDAVTNDSTNLRGGPYSFQMATTPKVTFLQGRFSITLE